MRDVQHDRGLLLGVRRRARNPTRVLGRDLIDQRLDLPVRDRRELVDAADRAYRVDFGDCSHVRSLTRASLTASELGLDRQREAGRVQAMAKAKATVVRKITTSEVMSVPFETVQEILIAHFQCPTCTKLVIWGEPSGYDYNTCNSENGDAISVELHTKIEREET